MSTLGRIEPGAGVRPGRDGGPPEPDPADPRTPDPDSPDPRTADAQSPDPRTPDPDSELARVTIAVRALDRDGVRPLEGALAAMAAGDFTVALSVAGTVPFGRDVVDPELRALVDLVNGLQSHLDGAVDAYEALRHDLTVALGDHSCLPDLLLALRSLNAHCLTDLDGGLQAMADGDFTRAAQPITHPLRAAPGDSLGEIGEVFNDMLARSRTALRSYDAFREDLRAMLGDHSALDELRRGLRSIQRHCLRDIEEALEALVEGTELTRRIGPVTTPITSPEGDSVGELAELFNRALKRAQTAVAHLSEVRERKEL